MSKSTNRLVLTLCTAALFGWFIAAPFGLIGMATTTVMAAYMYHFRTFAADWDSRETFFNLAAGVLAIVAFLGSRTYPLLIDFVGAFTAAYATVWMVAFGCVLTLRYSARRRARSQSGSTSSDQSSN